MNEYLQMLCMGIALFAGAVIGHVRFTDDWRKIKRFFAWVLCIVGFVFAIASPMIYEYIRVCTDWFDFGWTYNSMDERWSNSSFGATFSLLAFMSFAGSVLGFVALCSTMGKDK